MTPQTMIKPDVAAAPYTDATAGRGYVYPTVRALAMATAHPSEECWAIAERNQTSQVVISSERPRARSCSPLSLTAGAKDAPRDGIDATASASARFDALQRRLPAVEAAARTGRARTLVVAPSRTIDTRHEPPSKTQAYEERLLCTLLELRDPALRITYVTSSPIAPAIIDYYLSLLPRKVRRHARSRLTLIALGERTTRPLSQKLLERPGALARIRGSIPDPAASCLVPYNTTALEVEVAVELGIPMYGADPCHAPLGTKSGCRELFARAGVPHSVGREGITSVATAIEAIQQLRREKPALTQLVMKLNEGVSGQGNALVDLTRLPEPGAADEMQRIALAVENLAPEACGVSATAFLAKLGREGGIVEEWITGRELRSPSVQLQITPNGEVELLSTHDQILGGPHGQSYLGCRFPATPSYAPAISGLAHRVAARLADAGVIGRFAIDFVVFRDEQNRWQPFAIELNLRKGGTTHPYETLAHLTGGRYDAESAAFIAPTGQHKHYVATDHMEAPQLRALGRDGVLALTRRGDLGFDRMQRTGAVFHMLSSLDALGRTGFTAIADSAEEADALYERVHATLLDPSQASAVQTTEAAATALYSGLGSRYADERPSRALASWPWDTHARGPAFSP